MYTKCRFEENTFTDKSYDHYFNFISYIFLNLLSEIILLFYFCNDTENKQHYFLMILKAVPIHY